MLKIVTYIAFFIVFQPLISFNLLAMDDSVDKSDVHKNGKHTNHKIEKRIPEQKYDNSRIIWEKSTIPSNSIPMHEEDPKKERGFIPQIIQYVLGY